MRARIKGRQPGNLSRSLKTMSRYGLEDLQREKTQVRPVFKATGFRFPLAAQVVEFAIEPAPEGQRQFINTGLERSVVALRQVSSVLQHSNPYLSQAALGKIGQLQVQGLIFAPKPSRP